MENEVNEMEYTNSTATKWRTATMLIMLIQFLALFVALIVLGLRTFAPDPVANQCIIDQDVRVCLTPECIQAASTLIAHMNRTANPCDDFYEFACGGWNRSNPMPDDKSSYSAFEILDKQLIQNLKRSLTKTGRLSNNPTETTGKMQNYYSQCCDGNTNDRKAWDVLRRVLASFRLNMENWPFLDNTAIGNFTQDSLIFALSLARRQGNSLGLINPVILPDPRAHELNVIYFDLPTLTLQRSYYLSQTDPEVMIVARQAYKEYGKQLASLVNTKLNNANSSPEDFDLLFSEILEFETILLKATAPLEEAFVGRKAIKLYEMSNYTTAATPINFSASGWVDYLIRVWPGLHERIHVNMEVHVLQTEYFQALGAALAGKLTANQETGLRFLANYMGFKIVEAYLKVLPDEARAISIRLENVLGGISAQPPRWETCVRLLNKQLPNAVGRMYVQNYFRVEAKAEVETMTKYLLASFKRILQESDWMDEETRARAMEKVNKITPLVAYEDYLMNNDSRVNTEHASFVVQNDLLDTFINAQNFATEVEGKNLLRYNTPSDWKWGPATINAYNDLDFNSIQFPAGILNAPFWGYGYPSYWNFATIGTVIGHEITHGFDDTGSQLDGDGRIVDWWSPESKAAFRNRADGIVKQYGYYWYLGSQIDGEGTEGDNIADNGGIKQSFMAYQTYIKDVRNGVPEPHLPGFHTFTSEKMFYLSYAQMWCSDLTPQGMKNRQNDAHSPRRFRIIGPVQNSASFAEAYRCAPGTPMNPIIKYGVW